MLAGQGEGGIQVEGALVLASGGSGVAGFFGVEAEGEMNLIGVLPFRIHLKNLLELGGGFGEMVGGGEGAGQ